MTKVRGIIRKVFVLLVPVLVVASVGWFLRNESDFFLIQDIPVQIEYETSQRALLASLKPELDHEIQALKGLNIWKASLSGLRDSLLANPWVRDVEMSRRFPDKISALISLEKVSFLYMDKKNTIFPILSNGRKLQKIKATLAPLAPILRNNNILQDEKLLEKVIQLFSEIPQIGALKKENIASVDYNSVTGLTLQLIKGDVTVHLGEKNIQAKVLQVLRVTNYLESQKQKARVIDASFTKKVLVRLRKRS